MYHDPAPVFEHRQLCYRYIKCMIGQWLGIVQGLLAIHNCPPDTELGEVGRLRTVNPEPEVATVISNRRIPCSFNHLVLIRMNYAYLHVGFWLNAPSPTAFRRNRSTQHSQITHFNIDLLSMMSVRQYLRDTIFSL